MQTGMPEILRLCRSLLLIDVFAAVHVFLPDMTNLRKAGGLSMIKNRMKEYRARYDMKQEDLAKLVGVRRETIGNLEKGRYNPSLALAWNIAKAFHVTIEEVFTVE